MQTEGWKAGRHSFWGLFSSKPSDIWIEEGKQGLNVNTPKVKITIFIMVIKSWADAGRSDQ